MATRPRISNAIVHYRECPKRGSHLVIVPDRSWPEPAARAAQDALTSSLLRTWLSNRVQTWANKVQERRSLPRPLPHNSRISGFVVHRERRRYVSTAM